MAYTYFTITLLILGLALRSTTAATSCYVCTSTINDKNVEVVATGAPLCASVPSSLTATDAADNGCYTTVSTAGGVTTITRGIATTKAVDTVNQCTAATGGGSTCTCNSDKCNTVSYAAPRTYQCYQCSSVDYFDNGCGEKVDASSKWVRTISGCSACYKTVTVDSDAEVTYERGCTRSVNIDDTCDGDEKLSGRRCGCTKDLCNSAQSVALKSVSVLGAAVVLIIAKVFC